MQGAAKSFAKYCYVSTRHIILKAVVYPLPVQKKQTHHILNLALRKLAVRSSRLPFVGALSLLPLSLYII